MDTVQIQHALQGVNSFLGVYASDLLPLSIAHTGTIIVNTDPHTEPGTHWQAIHFQNPHRFSSGYFFDSYGRYPHIPGILDFIRHCTVWQYNKTRLQGSTTTVCGEYCCLFALYMDRGYTPQQFERLFATAAASDANHSIHRLLYMDRGYTPQQLGGLFATAASDADQRIHRLFVSEFGPTLCKQRRGGQCCTSLYKR